MVTANQSVHCQEGVVRMRCQERETVRSTGAQGMRGVASQRWARVKRTTREGNHVGKPRESTRMVERMD